MAALADFLLSLYASLLVMRGLMDLAAVSGRPLLNRLIVLSTEPVLRPFRWLLPRSGRLDWSIPLALLIIQFLVILMLTRMAEIPLPWSTLVVIALLRSVQLIALLMLVLVISSYILRKWSRPLSHPLVPLINEIVDWLLGPMRRRIPGISGGLQHGLATVLLLLGLVLVSSALLLL